MNKHFRYHTFLHFWTLNNCFEFILIPNKFFPIHLTNPSYNNPNPSQFLSLNHILPPPFSSYEIQSEEISNPFPLILSVGHKSRKARR